MNQPRVLVTGGDGFLGNRLMCRLNAVGSTVLSYDVQKSKADTVLDGERLIGVVEDFNPNVIVHLAGPVLGTVRLDPARGVELQIAGTMNVLEACRSVIARLVLASSFYVYDGIDAEWVVNEKTPLATDRMEMFGLSKFTAERCAAEYQRLYGVEWDAPRFGSMYGGQGGSNVVDEFVGHALAGTEVEVWGDGSRSSQYTHVNDVVEGLIDLICYHEATSRAINLISPEVTTMRQLAEMIQERIGGVFTFDETRPPGESMAYMSPQWAEDNLFWTPRSLAKGLDALCVRS